MNAMKSQAHVKSVVKMVTVALLVWCSSATAIERVQAQGINRVQAQGINRVQAQGINRVQAQGINRVQAQGINRVEHQKQTTDGNQQGNSYAQNRGKVIDPNGQGLNQAQIDAMERQRQLMWNSTGGGMVYR